MLGFTSSRVSEAFPFPPYRVSVEVKTREQVSRFGVVSRAHYHTSTTNSKTRKDPDPRTGSPKPPDRLRTLTQASQTTDNCRQETMKVFSILPLVAASLGMNLKEPVVNEVMDMVESGLGETKEGRALFITLTLTESTWYG